VNTLSIKLAIVISIVMLLLAILPLPYGYYTLLRLVVCITVVLLAWQCYIKQKISWVWLLGFIALIFNPVFPLYFEKGLWIVIDLIVAIILSVYLQKSIHNNMR